MGVCHSAMAVAGVYVGESIEAVMEWFVKNTDLTMDEVEHGDTSQMVYDTFGNIRNLEVHCENLMTGEGHYLGFECYDWRDYHNQINYFKLQTGINEGVDIHEFVKVH